MRQGIGIKGVYRLHFIIRDKETGERREYHDEIRNLVTTEGFNSLLDIMFHGTSQINPWYLGLKGTGSAAVGDTYASHGGWSEVTVYSGDRVAFNEGAAANASITNSSSVANFLITSAAQVYGACLVSVASKTVGSGVLFSAGDISSFRTVDSGDQINITYTVGSGAS